LPAAQFLAQLGKNFFQQRWIQQGLSFRKTAQADGPPAHLLLDARQMTGSAKPTHGAHDRIEQTQQKQAQILRRLELATAIFERGMLPPLLHGFR